MTQAFFSLFLLLFVACSNNPENNTASPGTLHPGEAGSDTSRLITDSVRIKDSNTTDVEVMKKIN